MTIHLSRRIEVHHCEFGRRVDARTGALIDFEHYQTTRQSRGFPCDALRRLQLGGFGAGIDDIRRLVAPSHDKRGALLLRPIAFSSTESDPCHGAALQRFCVLKELSFADHARSFVEIGSLLFKQADWVHYADAIIDAVASAHTVEPTKNDVDPRDALALPECVFDLTPPISPRLRDCAPASFAALDALAAGRRAIFGRETFDSDLEFLKTCRELVALLPPALRSGISLASGFTMRIPDALIQWLDARVTPPAEGPISAAFAKLPGETPVDEASRRIFGKVEMEAASSAGSGDDPFQRHARRRFAELLVHERAPRASQARAPIRFATGDTRMADDPAAVADSMARIEDTLATTRLLAQQRHLTGALEIIVKAAIADLRKVTIQKSHEDVKTNSSFLAALSASPHVMRVTAAMVAAGDRELRNGIELALLATALLPSDFDATRTTIMQHLLNVSAPSPRASVRILGFDAAWRLVNPGALTPANGNRSAPAGEPHRALTSATPRPVSGA
jgi:hypothetical protein